MKWASMWMYVDLKVSADEMPCRAVPCRAVHNFTQQCGSLLRCVLPSLGSILITSSLDDEAAGIRIPAADAVVTSSAGAGLISLLCPQHHRYR